MSEQCAMGRCEEMVGLGGTELCVRGAGELIPQPLLSHASK